VHQVGNQYVVIVNVEVVKKKGHPITILYG